MDIKRNKSKIAMIATIVVLSCIILILLYNILAKPDVTTYNKFAIATTDYESTVVAKNITSKVENIKVYDRGAKYEGDESTRYIVYLGVDTKIMNEYRSNNNSDGYYFSIDIPQKKSIVGIRNDAMALFGRIEVMVPFVDVENTEEIYKQYQSLLSDLNTKDLEYKDAFKNINTITVFPYNSCKLILDSYNVNQFTAMDYSRYTELNKTEQWDVLSNELITWINDNNITDAVILKSDYENMNPNVKTSIESLGTFKFHTVNDYESIQEEDIYELNIMLYDISKDLESFKKAVYN